jgi:flagellar biosynthesis anti-sigma factor FlgM
MRVDAYNKVNQLYQSTATKNTKSTEKTTGKDTVVISQVGRDYQIAKQAVQNAPDIREDKVSQIKAGIASGTYNVSAKEAADRLVDNYFDASI